MKRLKEQNWNNNWTIGHDGVGNYVSKNGIREYTLITALTDGLSTTANGDTAPRGSTARTTHATGRDQIFVAGAATWEAVIGGSGGDIGGIAATGYYAFLSVPVDNSTRSFNGTAVSWQTVVADADVEVEVVTALNGVDHDLINDTLLGVNLENMVDMLNASEDAGIEVATYSTNKTQPSYRNGTRIIVTHDTEGVAGNAFALGTANDALATRSAATLTGGVDATVGQKVYDAVWTQATTAAPTVAIDLKNELGGTAPVLARTNAGIYTMTKVGAFPAAKTVCKPSRTFNSLSPFAVIDTIPERTSDDVITVRVTETVYTAANNITIAAKEISAITAPAVNVNVIVKN